LSISDWVAVLKKKLNSGLINPTLTKCNQLCNCVSSYKKRSCWWCCCCCW